MSRTRKDVPPKFRFEPGDQDQIKVDGWGYRNGPTTKPKKRKEVDTEHHWMNTPSWWNNLFHTRPIRGNFRTFVSNAKKSSLEDIEFLLEPSDSKSPHKYYH